MRRLYRILLNALTVLSLLLFVATVALWVRSYGHKDGYGYGNKWIESYSASLCFGWFDRGFYSHQGFHTQSVIGSWEAWVGTWVDRR